MRRGVLIICLVSISVVGMVGCSPRRNGVTRITVDADGHRARTRFERALAILEASLGPDHPTTAENLNYLATVLHEEGDLADARRLHERSLAIRETRLGPDHPDTMRSRQSLAALTAELDNG